jgi:hypothetical protein
VRFWQSEKLDEQGRPLWAGLATYDERVGRSHTTGQIMHHISGNVDVERDHLPGALNAALANASQRQTLGASSSQLFPERTVFAGASAWHTERVPTR